MTSLRDIQAIRQAFEPELSAGKLSSKDKKVLDALVAGTRKVDDIGEPVCPACACPNYEVIGCSQTMVYYSPRIVDGVNVNPDRNRSTQYRRCLVCGTRYEVVQ